MKFGFGNIVAVENNTQVGVVCKLWKPNKGEPYYEIYVRSYNRIVEYKESEIRHLIYDKEITEESRDFYLSSEEFLEKQGIDVNSFMENMKTTINNPNKLSG